MPRRGCGCTPPTNQRITEQGYVELSYDGGLTWERLVADPRFNAPIFPPLVGVPIGDEPCVGAKSGREAMRIVIQHFIDDEGSMETVLTIITFLIEMLGTLLGPVGIAITSIISGLVWILFQAGRAAYLAVDWPTELDKYLCILFCNIESDASFTEAGWQQVKQDIVDQMDGIAETWFWNMVNTLGTVGLTNACRLFPGLAGDCNACGCGECNEPALVPGEPGTNLHSRPDLGAGWWEVTLTEVPSSPAPNFYATIVVGCCLHVEYDMDVSAINAAPGNRVATNCEDDPVHTGDYGVNNCVGAIFFRATNTGNVRFKIQECP